RCGIRIYTSGDVEAVNGTDVRLKCTFQSSATINPDLVIISWTFRPLKGGREESVSLCLFHYQQKAYPPTEGIFRKKIHWAGDVMGGDASIRIQEVKFIYNGTYICQVKNPPDVHGPVGQIQLRVVLSGKERGFLTTCLGKLFSHLILARVFRVCWKVNLCLKPLEDSNKFSQSLLFPGHSLCSPALWTDPPISAK
uniref:Myelin protein zero-like protein 2 n=1 Tax=Kryptolebias marmoratus TaxID=37003 RepID=A0A3Q3BHY4_KRYMA